jgi:hypothetical protein
MQMYVSTKTNSVLPENEDKKYIKWIHHLKIRKIIKKHKIGILFPKLFWPYVRKTFEIRG